MKRILQCLAVTLAATLLPTGCVTVSTPLHDAAKNGDAASLQRMIDHGADVNSRDIINLTPLIWAAVSGHTECIKLLLSKGADINARSDYRGWTALAAAASAGQNECVRLLVKGGEDKNSRAGALAEALQNGHAETVKLLVELGVVSKETALGGAVLSGKLEMVRLALDMGADTNAISAEGKTALDYAREKGNVAIVNLLESVAGSRMAARLKDATLAQLLEQRDFGNEAFVAALTDKLIEAKNRELAAFIAKATVEQRVALVTTVEKRLAQAQTQVGKCNNDAESFVRQGNEADASASRSLAVSLQAYQGVLKAIQELLNQS